MQNRNLSLGFLAAVMVAVTVLGAATRSIAQQESVLYSFGNGTDASDPQGDLAMDAAGNFYSTSWSGGEYGLGTVYELSPGADGTWTEQVLYSFGNGTDSANPRSGVTFDAAGVNLYGAAVNGGAYGQGTVFELSPAAGGGWTEKILFSFDGTDGTAGWDRPIFDGAGNLYGTSGVGGVYGEGVLYKLAPHADGTWAETVLHNFGKGTDGTQPQGALIHDAESNLYGTTTYGGTSWLDNGWNGIVFELSPKSGGGWTYTVLHNFTGGSDGANPFAGVTMDASGNLYGVTYFGQTVFKMTLGAGGTWTLETLYTFDENSTQGSSPWPTVTLAGGKIYGSAQWGDPNNGGTAFEIGPTSDGNWGYKVLHSFGLTSSDGANPSFSKVVVDKSGTEYGITWAGGAYGGGAFYQITP